MQKWRLIDTGKMDAAWNMAIDEALMRSFRPNDRPILRLYEWEPALSFGRFSRPAESVDMVRLEQRNISPVRRITGGGILVHGGDLSYSIILPASFAKTHGVKGSYRHLCRFLLRLYDEMGLQALFACETPRPESRSEICLAGSEAYDILIDGRKIGGNAQRHSRRAMLQHGSLPLRYDTELFGPLFLKDPGFGRSVSLEALGMDLSAQTLRPLLLDAFSKSLEADLSEDTMRSEEWRLARQLYASKYTDTQWTFDGKEPIKKA